MKVIIAGSRGITDYAIVEQAFRSSKFDATLIISGTAPGVDRLGEQVAFNYAISIAKFPANWTRYKQQAGVFRNIIMSEFADALVAVWDGRSKGTKHMIELMEALGKPVFVYRTDEL